MDVDLEAIPAVVTAIASLVVLPNGLAQARWLTRISSLCLLKAGFGAVLARTSPHVQLLKIMTTNTFSDWHGLAGSSGVSQALSLWQSQMLKSFGLTNTRSGS